MIGFSCKCGKTKYYEKYGRSDNYKHDEKQQVSKEHNNAPLQIQSFSQPGTILGFKSGTGFGGGLRSTRGFG